MNLKQLLHKIETFAKKQKFVNSVSLGDVYENWNSKPNMKYGAVNIDIPQIIVNDNMQQMQVYLYYADRLAHDHSNEYDVKTTAELVLNNIINYCAEIGDVNEGWTISLFNQQFADELAGGYVSFYLEIEKPFGECLIDEYEDDEEKLIERLKEAIRQYEEENAELAILLKEILHKLTGEIV